MTSVIVVLLISWIWPSSQHPLDLLWTVAPRDDDRARIWRLILPTEALDFGAPEEPAAAAAAAAAATSASTATASSRASMVKRVSESVGVARLLSPDHRRQQPTASEHSWTFRPQTDSARDRTPLLVFINRGSGGRQGEATAVHLRALLSPQQARAAPTPRHATPHAHAQRATPHAPRATPHAPRLTRHASRCA